MPQSPLAQDDQLMLLCRSHQANPRDALQGMACGPGAVQWDLVDLGLWLKPLQIAASLCPFLLQHHQHPLSDMPHVLTQPERACFLPVAA